MAGREMRRLDGTGQARHHRLGQTGAMRPGATWRVKSRPRNRKSGQRVLTGKGICFPQTLAQAKCLTGASSGIDGCLNSGFLYFSLPHARPVPVRSWSCTTLAPVPGSPTALELGFSHVTVRAISQPVTFSVAGAVLGPPNFGALVPACTTWLREDATSSLVTGSPDPVGEAALFLGLLPLRVGTFRLSTCPLIKGDPSWPDAMPNVAPLWLARLPARCPSPTPTPQPSTSTPTTTSSACPPTAPHRMSGRSVRIPAICSRLPPGSSSAASLPSPSSPPGSTGFHSSSYWKLRASRFASSSPGKPLVVVPGPSPMCSTPSGSSDCTPTACSLDRFGPPMW